MKSIVHKPPRRFVAGQVTPIEIAHCATIDLDSDEQITFITGKRGEYDVVRKSWGFYATPSLNGRLPSFGLRGCLIKNRSNKFYVVLVESGSETDFARYLSEDECEVVMWLDDAQTLERCVSFQRQNGGNANPNR